jgi:hypothetical protein
VNNPNYIYILECLRVTILVLLTVVFYMFVLCHLPIVLGSISTVFNQANLHSTSLNNVDGQCEILAMARYDKTGIYPPIMQHDFCTIYCLRCILKVIYLLVLLQPVCVASLFRLTFTSAADYLANEHCMKVLDIRNFGYAEKTFCLLQLCCNHF